MHQKFSVIITKTCFLCLQDKIWIKMPKWNIFLISSEVFDLITENFWRIFWWHYLTPYKNLVPLQKVLCWHLKMNLLNTNHLLVWDKNFGTGAICKSVFGMAQNIWTSPKCFGTRKKDKAYASTLEFDNHTSLN